MVKDIDRGWAKFKANMRTMRGAYTKVGLQQGEKHKAENGGMTEAAQIGAIHEFGTRRIPQRSFLRASFDEKASDIGTMKEKLAGKVISGKMETVKAVGVLGEYFQGVVKNRIVAGIAPANAESTQKRKAKLARKKGITFINTPLRFTSEMLNSIRHVEVV